MRRDPSEILPLKEGEIFEEEIAISSCDTKFLLDVKKRTNNGITDIIFPITKEQMVKMVKILNECLSRNSSESSEKAPDYLP
jgi:hypothetical protein